MIENIESINIDKELLTKLKEDLEYNELLDLACNYKNVNENIELLKMFNIENIDELLLYRSFIFLEDKETLAKKFSKFNVPALVKLINEDYMVIDELF